MDRLDLTQSRDIGALLTTTVTLLREHFALFLSLTLLVVAPAVVLVDGVWGRMLVDGPHAHPSPGPVIVSGLLSALVVPSFVTALHVIVVRGLAEGRAPTFTRAVRDVAPRLPAALGATALYTIGVSVGFLLLVIPGVMWGVRWYFAAQSAVLDRTGPNASVRQSAALVEGRWWETFGALLVSGVLFGGGAALAGAALRFVHAGVPYVSLYVLIRAVHLSLSALFGTLLFFSLRARQRASAAEPAVPA